MIPAKNYSTKIQKMPIFMPIKTNGMDNGQKGLTKKQFWISIFPTFIFLLMAADWVVMGITDHSIWLCIVGFVYMALVVAYMVFLIIRRRRYPVENEEIDRLAVRTFKDGALGMGIVMGVIAIALLIAFGIVFLLK